MVRDGKKRFDALCETDSVMQHYAFVLEMLLRLRQACCHPSLVPEKYRTGFATLSEEELGHLKQLLEHLDQSLLDAEVECCVCLTALDMPVVTPCKHVFCRPCLNQVMDVKASCPLCRAPISESALVEPSMKSIVEREEKRKLGEDVSDAMPSSKLAALLDVIRATRAQKGSGAKIVVFSQWTSFLDIIGERLKEQQIVYTRLDGSLSNSQRQLALQRFQLDPAVTVMLVSLKAGGVGISLTAASTCIFMDPWWNASQEEQAEDRIYRMGQTQDVDIIRFIVKDSIEDRVISIQDQKKALIKGAFDRSQKEMRQERLEDLQKLFAAV